MSSISPMASHSQAAPSTLQHSCAEEFIAVKKQTVNSYSVQGVGQREDCWYVRTWDAIALCCLKSGWWFSVSKSKPRVKPRWSGQQYDPLILVRLMIVIFLYKLGTSSSGFTRTVLIAFFFFNHFLMTAQATFCWTIGGGGAWTDGTHAHTHNVPRKQLSEIRGIKWVCPVKFLLMAF